MIKEEKDFYNVYDYYYERVPTVFLTLKNNILEEHGDRIFILAKICKIEVPFPEERFEWIEVPFAKVVERDKELWTQGKNVGKVMEKIEENGGEVLGVMTFCFKIEKIENKKEDIKVDFDIDFFYKSKENLPPLLRGIISSFSEKEAERCLEGLIHGILIERGREKLY